mmetsp:Transcript_88346/g.175668  ORF Transcript_88346/g.175668 Transcript_88346/m.175668 type:complete len:240 (+) Transcript_88346:288-1007(+)
MPRLSVLPTTGKSPCEDASAQDQSCTDGVLRVCDALARSANQVVFLDRSYFVPKGTGASEVPVALPLHKLDYLLFLFTVGILLLVTVDHNNAQLLEFFIINTICVDFYLDSALSLERNTKEKHRSAAIAMPAADAGIVSPLQSSVREQDVSHLSSPGTGNLSKLFVLCLAAVSFYPAEKLVVAVSELFPPICRSWRGLMLTSLFLLRAHLLPFHVAPAICLPILPFPTVALEVGRLLAQ